MKILKEPTLMHHSDASLFLWGDEDSHQVSDYVYSRGERIASLMFSLRVDGGFLLGLRPPRRDPDAPAGPAGEKIIS